MKTRTKQLTTNNTKIKLALEDIKRLIDSNAEPKTKVQKIEDKIETLYE